MRKIISGALLCGSLLASAQVSLAGKANVIIPTSSASWKNLKTAATTAIEEKGKNITGYNVGLSLKVNLPASLYLMPEVYYTNYSNEVTLVNDATAEVTTFKAKSNRFDIPILIGRNLLGNYLSVYAGPVGSFNINSDENFSSFVQKLNVKSFSVGYQIGFQSEISKLILSAKYEGAFSKDQRTFINTVAGSSQEINYDNRPSFFLLGLGYKF